MRAAALALAAVVVAGIACKRESLQRDAGRPGPIGLDAAGDTAGGTIGDGGPAPTDGPPPRPDVMPPSADANCGVVTRAIDNMPKEILILLDQTVSDREQWTSLLMAVAGAVVGNGATIDWGLYTFPEPGPACAAETFSTDIDLPVTETNYIAANAALGSTRLNGNGSATAAAVALGAAYLNTLTDESRKLLMLVTDGRPTCAGTIGALADAPELAQVQAVTAIAAAAAQGFQTLVVAPSRTPDSEVDALDALAVAGGLANPVPRGKFATEGTVGPLLLGQDPTCGFALPTAPPVPDAVTVTIDGVTVPRDRSFSDGWAYDSDGTFKTIVLLGSWCDRTRRTRRYQIDVYYGCPTDGWP